MEKNKTKTKLLISVICGVIFIVSGLLIALIPAINTPKYRAYKFNQDVSLYAFSNSEDLTKYAYTKDDGESYLNQDNSGDLTFKLESIATSNSYQNGQKLMYKISFECSLEQELDLNKYSVETVPSYTIFVNNAQIYTRNILNFNISYKVDDLKYDPIGDIKIEFNNEIYLKDKITNEEVVCSTLVSNPSLVYFRG